MYLLFLPYLNISCHEYLSLIFRCSPSAFTGIQVDVGRNLNRVGEFVPRNFASTSPVSNLTANSFLYA